MNIEIMTKTEISELIKSRTKFLTKRIDKLRGRIDLLERKNSQPVTT